MIRDQGVALKVAREAVTPATTKPYAVGPTAVRLVLGHLTLHAKPDGRMWAAHDVLADALGLTVQTVKRALKCCRCEGLLTLAEGGRGRGRVSVYRAGPRLLGTLPIEVVDSPEKRVRTRPLSDDRKGFVDGQEKGSPTNPPGVLPGKTPPRLGRDRALASPAEDQHRGESEPPKPEPDDAFPGMLVGVAPSSPSSVVDRVEEGHTGKGNPLAPWLAAEVYGAHRMDANGLTWEGFCGLVCDVADYLGQGLYSAALTVKAAADRPYPDGTRDLEAVLRHRLRDEQLALPPRRRTG